jgi:TfoX/Sxy family transcriptional regulator of competence genes
MAFDEGLAHRLRELTEEKPNVLEKKMFGGLSFLVSGNMCFGIVGDELMVRVGPDAYAECLDLPHAREMDFTGRAMKGMIYVSTDGFEEDDDLEAWVSRGFAFAASLPAKSATRKKSRKKPVEGAPRGRPRKPSGTSSNKRKK